MTLYYRPALCSEIRDPDQRTDDCAWCSANMLANASSGGRHPADLAEAEQIELAAGGPFPGGSPALAQAGLINRYGFHPAHATDAANIIAAAKPGTGLAVSGVYGNLPVARRAPGSTGFTGHHEMYFSVEDASVWRMDPLRPQGYAGDPSSLAELAAFAQGGLGGLFAPLYVVPPPPPPDPSPYAPHVVRVTPLRLFIHTTAHQASPVVATMLQGQTARTVELLVHGEAYMVGAVRRTDWLHVTFAGKHGWLKRGWTALLG